jgi:hypothetical protein
MTDVQAHPDKLYFQYTDVDRDEPDLEQNCAISYDEAADLWQKLRAGWLTSAGKEDLRVFAGNVEEGDLIMGYDVESVTFNLNYAIIHLYTPYRGASREIKLFIEDLIEVTRDIR